VTENPTVGAELRKQNSLSPVSHYTKTDHKDNHCTEQRGGVG